MSDRERFLAVGTPKEWDCWLSYMADSFAPRQDYFGDYFPRWDDCLFCLAFKFNCGLCIPESRFWGKACMRIYPEDRIDRAIARLEAAGVWD